MKLPSYRKFDDPRLVNDFALEIARTRIATAPIAESKEKRRLELRRRIMIHLNTH